MPRRRLPWILATIALIAAAGLAVWWFLLRADAPPPVNLDDAVAAVTSTTSSAVITTTVAGLPTTTSPTTDPSGTWTVSDDSFAGYRVQEELVRIGFTTAAGRTDRVSGFLVIDAGLVTAVTIEVDMTTLESDDDRRDGALRRQALETDTFPTASFALTETVALPATATAGSAFAIDATGDLTIHGVTRRVTLPLDAQYVDGVIVVVGTARVVFADYDIARPTAMSVLSVEDEGDLEFQLVFRRD